MTEHKIVIDINNKNHCPVNANKLYGQATYNFSSSRPTPFMIYFFPHLSSYSEREKKERKLKCKR